MYKRQFITSDDHAGLKAVRRAVMPGVMWQRCQFHLGQNAVHHCPNLEAKDNIGKQLRRVWNAETLEEAKAEIKSLVAYYRQDKKGHKLADWMEANLEEGLAVFALPEKHRNRMRTSNPHERCIQQELKRRTAKVRVFPDDGSLLRLVSAVLVEIDEKWTTQSKPYIKWELNDERDTIN